MIENQLKKKLQQYITQCKINIERFYDNVDKIEAIRELIKSIMDAIGINEIVLAAPILDEDLKDFHHPKIFEVTIDERIEQYKRDPIDFYWFEPKWITHSEYDQCLTIYKYYSEGHYEPDEFVTIVRIAKVEGTVKYTCQSELANDGGIKPETQWLRMENIIEPKRWLEIASAIVNIREVMEFSETYPQFHKL